MNELQHYGVKGMKWGHRKKRELTDVDVKRAAYKQARKDFNKAYQKADNGSLAAFSPVKKHRQANDRRWNDAAAKNSAMKLAKSEYRSTKNAKVNSAIKDYNKKFNAAERASNKADKQWEAVQQQRQKLGKNKISRIVNAAKGNTPEAKKYKKMYDEWERSQNIADQKWNETRAAYKNTGRTYVTRVINNINYDIDQSRMKKRS